nr:predicted protein [Mycena chlorophos]
MAAPVVKDPKYFFSDGDCSLLVGGNLFKLHKDRLRCDPDSFFCNMFAQAKGSTEEVIPMQDEVEDFRALCWILYARPLEIVHDFTAEQIDTGKYMRLLAIAHKYLMPSIEAWAWTMACRKASAVPDYLAICSEEDLGRLLVLGIGCSVSAPELLGWVESAWLTRLRAGGVSFTHALSVGEQHARRRFQTHVYLELRRKLCFGPVVLTLADGFAKFGLTAEQLQRFLVGYALISNMVSIPFPRNTNLYYLEVYVFDRDLGYITQIGNRRQELSRHSSCTDGNHYMCEEKWREIHHLDESDLLGSLDEIHKHEHFACLRQHMEEIRLPRSEDIVAAFLGLVA